MRTKALLMAVIFGFCSLSQAKTNSKIQKPTKENKGEKISIYACKDPGGGWTKVASASTPCPHEGLPVIYISDKEIESENTSTVYFDEGEDVQETSF